MKVDLIASFPHYRAHLLPIFDALPAEMQGQRKTDAPLRGHVALVAGWPDVLPLRGVAKMIYVEHGAGQAYGGDERSSHWPGYSASGGSRHTSVIGYISPSETVASRWTRAPAVAVGCPKLDQYHGLRPPPRDAVCFVWHWDSEVCPEARWAWPHYADLLPAVVSHFRRRGVTVYGHAHPRLKQKLHRPMERAGMEILATDTDVFNLASAVFCDNSSLAFEMAALGRPVVSLNAPWYRRDVEHGLRFWSHVPGIQIDDPHQLLEVDPMEIIIADPGLDARRAAVEHCYLAVDGQASKRAAAFIEQLVAEM